MENLSLVIKTQDDFITPILGFRLNNSPEGCLTITNNNFSELKGDFLSLAHDPLIKHQQVEVVSLISNADNVINENTYLGFSHNFYTRLALKFTLFSEDEIDEWNLLDKYLPISKRMFAGKRRKFKL